MPACKNCSAQLASDAKFCPSCGTPVQDASHSIQDTMDAPASTPRTPSSSTSGYHGRFEPGHRLGERYRISGLLGKGGMGEVYRADDTEIEQQVALKFLPPDLAADPVALERFRREVRMARSISHPNICRTYDLATIDGHTFLVMEYVDGEDLASVVRRLGKVSQEKGLEIARQLCLGIGTAHEAGILHRDLKPANIMIDDRGKVRITDFGLAGFADDLGSAREIAGTPAYMAPEQKTSGTVSMASDIYSLGLVLQEIFTGERDPGTQTTKNQTGMASSTSHATQGSATTQLDPAIQSVLARCLEQDPSKRPPSAYSILAALPGGDPLAAALAAGEIPSLELVADSGGDTTLPVLPAILSLLTVVVAVLGVAHLQGRLLKPLTQPKAVLTAQADVLFEELTGKEPPRFSASGFLRQSPDSTLGANSEKLPSSEAFWKIWSSNTLLSKDFHYGGINETALGRLTLGETGMIITMDGELRGFRFVHPDTIGWELPSDHSGVFEAMNLNPSDYRQVTNQGIVKWRGAGGNGDPTEITAQYMSGNLSSITTTGPQIRTEPLLHPPLSRPEIPFFAVILTQLIPLVVSLLFAWRNVRLGRADFRGATTFASIVVVGYLLQWVFLISLNEMSLGTALTHLSAGAPFGHALVHGVSVWFAYLAVEPFMRRIRPGSLTSWVRLVDHRWRDALIGRDILAGLVIGSLTLLFYVLIAHYLAPSFPNALGKMIIVSAGIGGMSGSLAPLFYAIAWAPTLILLSLVLFLLLRLIVRRDRIAIAAFFLVGGIISLYYFLNPADLTVACVLAAAIFGGLTLLFTLLRFGVLAAVIYGFVIVLGQAPWSLDFGAWYGPMSMLSPSVVILFALWAAFIAVGDRVSAVLEES